MGSSAIGLMMRRDIDFNMLCPKLNADLCMEVVRPLASHPCVKKLRYSNETGRFNSTGMPPDEGYYWGVRYVSEACSEWKLDLWFLPESVPRPELELIRTMKARLTPESRLAILWIKDEYSKLPVYRDQIHGLDIYEAVLRHNLRTPEQFAEYLSKHNKPSSGSE